MSSLSCDKKNTDYQYLQVELTSRCNLSCPPCIRSAPGISLQEQDLDNSILHQLKPFLPHIRSVHLQGWGESILLDALHEHIRWFKSHGCGVSFTTNGTLMTECCSHCPKMEGF